MKLFKKIITLAILSSAIIFVGYSASAETIDDWMPDQKLQETILPIVSSLHPEIQTVDQITQESMADVHVRLMPYGDEITSLEGIQYAQSYYLDFSAMGSLTTEKLSNFVGNYLNNLEEIHWYLNDNTYSQIDLYSVFSNWKYFNTFDGSYHAVMTGTMNHESTSTINIPVESYSSGGQLKISLADLGIWSSTEYKLIKDSNLINPIDDIVIRDDIDGHILARYTYNNFDVETQTFIFDFDAVHSKPTEELYGKSLSYDMSIPNNQDVPVFKVDVYGNNDFSDLFQFQFHIFFYLSKIEFIPIDSGDVTVKYIDDTTGDILLTDVLTGEYNTVDTYRTTSSINDFKNSGYILVSDNYPETGATYTANPQDFEIHLKHGTSSITDQKIVTQTIHYIFENGSIAASDYKKEIRFTREIITDSVTGEKSYTVWNSNDGSIFPEVVSPTIKGYTPNKNKLEAITNITANNKSTELTVIYTKNDTGKNSAGNRNINSKNIKSLPRTGENKSLSATISGFLVLCLLSVFLFIKLKSKK